jgi:selenocysteine lyase/cysteine desulfurase
MLTRRSALGLLLAPAVWSAAPSAALRRRAAASAPAAFAALASADARGAGPAADARDEDLWASVAALFPVDRAVLNLNNGGVSPTPATALEAQRRYQEEANTAPAYTLWRHQEPRREAVRAQLALAFGADPEELAIVRNASEGLETLQLGRDLPTGARILCSDQDYPRMLTTFEQRAAREGLAIDRIALPTAAEDDEEVLERYRAAWRDDTRLVLVSHAIFLTGQVLPIAALQTLCRERGATLLVDGAHAFAHLDFRLDELGVDSYVTSLHKWLCAPHGNGLIYLQKSEIPSFWPLLAAAEAQRSDIRKFEETGTRPAAPALAIAESLALHQAIGPARKLARLYHLRSLWLQPLLAASDRVHLHTSLTPGRSTAMALISIDGLDPAALAGWLWEEHRILVTTILHPQFSGQRISPSLYTTPAELSRFVSTLEHALTHGLTHRTR